MSSEKQNKYTVEISFDEVRELLNLPPKPEMPKYSSQLINLANQFAQGTRPKVVGQMSELIEEFKKTGGKTFEDWKKWYLQRYEDAIDLATEKIWKMLENFKETLNSLSKENVKRWVEDLVLVKTYEGLMIQTIILKELSEKLGGDYRIATAAEEAKGIDGIIILKDKEIPISIKPETYIKQEKHLVEDIAGKLIIYKKQKDRIIIDYSGLLGD